MSVGLKRALALCRAAEDRVHSIIARDYPIGPAVRYTYGRGDLRQRGIVVEHGYGDRLKVCSCATAKEYWISAFRIVDAMA